MIVNQYQRSRQFNSFQILLIIYLFVSNKINKHIMKTDLEIKQNVIEEIKWEPILNAARIGVSVKDSVVTLA